MTDSEPPDQAIAQETSGTADEARLNLLIATAWRSALDEPLEKAEIAALLDVEESDLDPKHPPFTAKISGSGLTGAEILIALASGFILGIAKDCGGAAGAAASKKLRALWSNFLRDRVSPPGSGELGTARPDEEDGEG